MPTLTQRRRAIQAADELLSDLGVDQGKPIDVFEIINRLGLWLVFGHLDNLLGAVVPAGMGGVMLTTQRPPAVQRYTAAHEIGHWVLDVDEPAFDSDGDIFRPSIERELLAQLFAGQLLMPPPLVFTTCERYGISGSDNATGPAVYSVARDMGASYEAAARQLANLEIIGQSHLNILLTLPPKQLKAGLCHGHRPSSAVDVWPVDRTSDSGEIHIIEGDEVFIALPENRTTGHRWLRDDELNTRASRVAAPPPPPFGPAGDQDRHANSAAPHRRHGLTSDIARALTRVPGNTSPRRLLTTDSGSHNSAPVERTLNAAATEVQPADLITVGDSYEAGWAQVTPAAIRTMRRAIAGLRSVAPPATLSSYLFHHDEESTPGIAPSLVPVSATGLRLLTLKSVGEGTRSVDLSYTSATDPQAPILERYHLDVVVSATPQVQRRRELLDVNFDEVSEPGDPS